MRKGGYTRLLLIILTLSLLFAFSGCHWYTKSYYFRICEKGDVYTCKISEEVGFWYSHEYECGEFAKGDVKFPFSMSGYGQYDTKSLGFHFYDSFGNILVSLQVDLDTSSEHSNESKVLLNKVKTLIVTDESQRRNFEDFFADIPFEGAYVYKVKKDIPSDAVPIFHIFDSFYENAKTTDAVIASEESNFWFEASTGYGEMTLPDGKTQEILVETGPWRHYEINSDTYRDYSKYYNRRDDLQFFCAYKYLSVSHNKNTGTYELSKDDTITEYYKLIYDEEGIFFVPGDGEESVKSTLKIATEDPRQEYRDFMSPMDDEGNNYTFMCEEGNFTFAGESGFGVWHDGTTDVDIQCTVGEKPFDFYISRIDRTEKTILVKAKLKAIVNENTVMFEIYPEYLKNEIFPDMPSITWYFYIIKQPETP